MALELATARRCSPQPVQRAPRGKAVVSCRGIEDEAQERNKGSFLSRKAIRKLVAFAVCANLTLRHDTQWLAGSRKARNHKNKFLAR